MKSNDTKSALENETSGTAVEVKDENVSARERQADLQDAVRVFGCDLMNSAAQVSHFVEGGNLAGVPAALKLLRERLERGEKLLAKHGVAGQGA